MMLCSESAMLDLVKKELFHEDWCHITVDSGIKIIKKREIFF